MTDFEAMLARNQPSRSRAARTAVPLQVRLPKTKLPPFSRELRRSKPAPRRACRWQPLHVIIGCVSSQVKRAKFCVARENVCTSRAAATRAVRSRKIGVRLENGRKTPEGLYTVGNTEEGRRSELEGCCNYSGLQDDVSGRRSCRHPHLGGASCIKNARACVCCVRVCVRARAYALGRALLRKLSPPAFGGVARPGSIFECSLRGAARDRTQSVAQLFGEVAIKTIKKSKIETEQDSLRIRREIQIMSSIQHPYIIHIYEVFENKDKIVLVMQYASGGELYDYVSERKELTSEEARRIFRQVASAVYYCHKVDCWSLGVLLYTLVYGAMPFDGSNFKRLVRQISEGDYYEPKRKSDASGLIRRLLTVDPAKRATVVDICQDRWVNQGFDHSLLQLAEDMSNLTPVRLDLLLALAPVSPTPEEPFDKEANAPDGAEKSESFDFQPAEAQINNVNDSVDFIPAALAAELEGQNIKRQCSTDGSLMRMSSVSHKNKKVRTSDSSQRTSVGLLGGPFVHDDDEFADEAPPEVQEKVEPASDSAPLTGQDEQEAPNVEEAEKRNETTGTPDKPMEQEEPTAVKEEVQKTEEQPPQLEEEKPAVQEERASEPTPPTVGDKDSSTAVTEPATVEEQSMAPMLARRGSGIRCPGKIVIPKCLSSQASPATNSASPKFKDAKRPPLPQTPKAGAAEPSIPRPEDAATPTVVTPEEAASEKVEHKKVIPVPKPSFEGAHPSQRTNHPSKKAARKQKLRTCSKATAEITLSNRKKAEELQQSSTLWDNAAPATPEELAEPDAPPRRPSPEGSAEEPTRVAADSPVRSYKKFTFGKDGTCITESGRVYAQPKSDGSWTTVEKKTKITRRPSNATSVDEEVVRSAAPPPKDELTIPRSASGSSSESNDIFNDMFPDWRTSSPFGNLMRMKSSIKKLNKGSLFRGGDPFASMETFRRERTPEKRAREWGRRGGGAVTTSTDRDSSDEDDFDLHFDNSHPQALFQFMRNMSRDFRNHWKSFLPSTSFSRSAKEPSQSSRPQKETLLRFVVDKPSKMSGSEPGTPHARAGGGDPFSKRSSGVWDPIDRASLFGTLRRNRFHDLPSRHHDRGTSLDRGGGNSDFWGVHQDPEGTRHRVEKWLHLSNDGADPQQGRGDEGSQRCQQKYNRSQSDKFHLG
ncbi:hypothetical protein HPB48_000328 [Haemaphysalis longicornis]|uniref:Protein kinase domain-containing protein n=1 Tax=Haemaphysalis longicornis TaxID=44386 RepID=A0A9J6FLE1_HAELO|nr:hypothetical protein HPB48_000328 [Haemaphysalis longicornis]